MKGAKGNPEKYADPSRIRKRANPRGGAGRSTRRPRAAVDEAGVTKATATIDATDTVSSG